MGYKNETIVPILMIITWSLLIPIAFLIIPDSELGHICDLDSSSNLPFTSDYNDGRSVVANVLRDNTPSHGGFWASVGWGNNVTDRCYGMALCRGDVSPEDCKSCVDKATSSLINTYCPNNRSAIIRYDYCFLKHSDIDFLGKVDIVNTQTLRSGDKLHLTSSRDAVKKLLSNLTQTAIQDPTKFYAKGRVTLPLPNVTYYRDPDYAYGMVQCTRDLTQDDCGKCLDVTLTKVPALKTGEHVVTGSCNIRYETYNFSNN